MIKNYYIYRGEDISCAAMTNIYTLGDRYLYKNSLMFGAHKKGHLIEDNEYNREWLLVEKLKGNIDLRIRIDLYKLNATNSFFDIRDCQFVQDKKTFK